MATLEELGCRGLVSDRVESGATHQQIAEELQHLYPNIPGLSSRSVRRFCLSNNIHWSSQLSITEVDQIVEQAVTQVKIVIVIPGSNLT